MKNKKSGFFKGALILMIFGLASKVIGAIYRIPLTGIITAEGMGLYQMVFPLYTLMLTISSSGIPSSISKLISENIALNRHKQASRILNVSFFLLLVFSFICSLIVVLFARVFASLQGNIDATICYLGLAPAIVFVGLISGFRGYFQGRECMIPSAVSQLIEQLIKLICGLYFASIFVKKGVSYGVLGALVGISLSEVVAFIYLLIRFLVVHKKRKQALLESDPFLKSRTKTAKDILSLSLFVTLGGLIMPLTMLIDSALSINILKSIGYSSKFATKLFGLQSGSVGSIVNMPVVLSLSVATAILPCIAKDKARGDLLSVQSSASKAIFITILFALPSFVGCLSLAEPIMKLLYAKSLTRSELMISVSLLKVASVSIFYLAMLQVTSGILQGLNRFYVPLLSLSVGGIVKIIANVLLIRINSVNILGAEAASSICYITALIINLAFLIKMGVIKLNAKILLLALFSFVVYFARYVFNWLVKLNLNYIISLIITLIIFIAIYFFMVFVCFRKKKNC